MKFLRRLRWKNSMVPTGLVKTRISRYGVVDIFCLVGKFFTLVLLLGVLFHTSTENSVGTPFKAYCVHRKVRDLIL